MNFEEKETRKMRTKEMKSKKMSTEVMETNGENKNEDKSEESNHQNSNCNLDNDFDCELNLATNVAGCQLSDPSTSSFSLPANQVGRKSMSGQSCSLKTLIDDGVLDAEEKSLSMEYMGAKFVADLLLNGTIRWIDTQQIFSTPSAWVNHCKKIVNPDNSGKTGSAWSTIRYKGKRLDSYKLRWYRKQKKMVNNNNNNNNNHNHNHVFESTTTTTTTTPSTSALIREHISIVNHRQQQQQQEEEEEEELEMMRKENIVEHESLSNKSSIQDMNVMVKCVPFSALERIQPFTVTVSTNALLLIDFHCHLTTSEVVGYLGGTWDITTHNLAVLQAFPCRSRLNDRERGAMVEEEIRQNVEQRNILIVGWYHSHPQSVPQPTVKDIESQMEYQIAMKGESDSSYVPCIGFICSPFDRYNYHLKSSYQTFWVMPPPEYKPFEYGKPMQMIHSITRDSFLTQHLLLEMRLLAHFYVESSDAIRFDEKYGKVTYWEKLQISLQPNLPRDLQIDQQHHHHHHHHSSSSSSVQIQQQALSHFWAFLKGLIFV